LKPRRCILSRGKRAAPGLLAAILWAAAAASSVGHCARVIPDVPFATVAGGALLLDLHLPDDAEPAGLIVWVHGGAFTAPATSRPSSSSPHRMD